MNLVLKRNELGSYLQFITYAPKYSVHLRTYASDKSGLQLYVRSVTKPGRYPLSFDTGDFTTYYAKNYGAYSISGATTDDPDYSYITTSQITGYVDFVVADTVTTQLSGTFEFEGIDFPSGKKIKVTNGRFDLNQLKR